MAVMHEREHAPRTDRDAAAPVYLDHAATTPLAPEVLAAMTTALVELHGNPANGSHPAGRAATDALDVARGQVGALIGAPADRIFFTSGATEANNLAIRGVAHAARDGERRTIIASAIEHRSVLCPADELDALGGARVVRAPVDADGVLDLDALDELLDAGTLLVCVHLANNEIGTIQPIAEVVERAHAAGALVLCDATQAVGKVPIDVDALGVDLLSLSAHKFHGPKGAGALFVARDVSLVPQVTGGGQECGIRAGTPNVPAIVAMGVAADVARESMEGGESARVAHLRGTFEQAILRLDPSARVNGGATARIPGVASITFPGRDGADLVAALPQLAISRGSACSTGSPKPSHVLVALGLEPADAFSTLRISFGASNEAADVTLAVEAFAAALAL